jgi:basic amino acid/polyamine antiporter, APA family
MDLLRTKSIEQSIRDTEEPEHQLRKDLSALDLTVFGIGVIIGTGIFVLTGIAAGAVKINTANWSPFIPPPAEAPKAANAVEAGRPLLEVLFGLKPLAYGWLGITFGAALVFFAHIGFDVVATTAAPMADALKAVGYNWIAKLVSLGVLAGLTTVVLILLLGQSRILFAMSRDRLLPAWLSSVHPRYRTPWVIPLITGVVVAAIATFVPLSTLADMVNIGTLFAFVLVSLGVLVLRRTRPDLPRAFRTAWVPVVPVLAVLSCLFLMLNLGTLTWWRFVIRMAIGLVVYFAYGYRQSRLARGRRPPAAR